MGDAADLGDMWRVALNGRGSSRKSMRGFPETRKVNSTIGYWERTVVAALEAEFNRYSVRVAAQSYIDPIESKTRIGADAEYTVFDVAHVPKTSVSPRNKSGHLYPDGKRLAIWGGAKARPHYPQDESVKSIRWRLNSHSVCFS